MTEYKGVNVTKYDAGGTGDNIVSDGYIKTVEKIWMDSFTMSTLLSTADTLVIATIPANKKITDILVMADIATPTTATINVGIAGDATKFIDSALLVETNGLGAIAVKEAVRMNNLDGLQYVATAETDIVLSIGVAAVATTAGTGVIKTVVKYTYS